MTKRVLSTTLVLLALTKLAAATPDWCKADGSSRLSINGLTELYTLTDARQAVEKLVAAVCYPDEDVAAQAKQIEAVRKAWSTKLGMIDADWADAAKWAQNTRSRDVASTPAKRAFTEQSAIDQYETILSSLDVDPSYLGDTYGSKLTETGRLGLIIRCVGDGHLSDAGDEAAARWAMCAPDVAAFDRKRIATELRADTNRGGADRMNVRFIAYEMEPLLVGHAARVKALLAKDAAYAKVFAVAANANKAWAPDPRLVELVAAMDDARQTGSRKKSDGCEATTWAAWASTVGAIPAKEFGHIADRPAYNTLELALGQIIGHPNGYLAALAVFTCGSMTNNDDFLIRSLGGVMKFWPGYRGPRTASQTAILTAGIALDDRDAKLKLPDVSRRWIEGNASGGSSGLGAIGGLATAGGVTTITFAKEKITQTVCAKGHTTNRIIQLRSDGGVVYEYVCTEQRTETIAVAPSPPLKVNARYASGLAKGMVVSVVDGVVAFAYTKSKSTLPSVIAGVTVK